MFGKKLVADMISRSAENEHDRRSFMRAAGLAGMGTVGAAALVGSSTTPAFADDGPSDPAILNFALNLEYLEAEFYSYAYWGEGLDSSLTSGKGVQGKVTRGHKVPFKTRAIKEYAREIAMDERNHVNFLRGALGDSKVAEPAIDITTSFTTAARAAGLIGAHQTFDPFANENNFLLAAFVFEDVGVTAYKGAAPLIDNPTYLGAAAGILAVEAYHAGIIREALYRKGLYDQVKKISNLRDAVDGSSDDDQGIRKSGHANLVPTDANSIAFGRAPGDVLNIVYLTAKSTTCGGFFPKGVNGELNTSSNNA